MSSDPVTSPAASSSATSPLAQATELITGLAAQVVKPGYQTTEFWAVIAGAAVIVLNKKFDLGLSGEDVAGLGAALAGYAFSRGLAKKS